MAISFQQFLSSSFEALRGRFDEERKREEERRRLAAELARQRVKQAGQEIRRRVASAREKAIEVGRFVAREAPRVQRLSLRAIEAGARALPLPQPEKVGRFIARKRGVSEEKIRRFEEKLPEISKWYAKPPKTTPEKVATGVGAGVSQVGQFVLAGKIADSLLSRLGMGVLKLRLAREMGKEFSHAPQVIRGMQGLISKGYITAKATSYLRGALQWGIYAAPRLQARTLQGKARELAGEMITGGALNQIVAANRLGAVQKYLATTVAPALIKATVAGKPKEAPKELLAYGLYGLPFLALGLRAPKVRPGKPPTGRTIVPQLPEGAPPAPPPVFPGFRDLSTKLVERLKGRRIVSRQFISDLTKMPDLKQAERELIRDVLKEFPQGKVLVKDFANKVKTELLPLEAKETAGRYENITLPDELRGNIANYFERIYESPIKTSAGQVHFGDMREPAEEALGPKKYFAHTRIEDLPDFKTKGIVPSKYSKFTIGGTRRIIEIQSDLFQKGILEDERRVQRVTAPGVVSMVYDDAQRQKDVDRLEPYKNTWYERIIKEEIKRAAQDGKTKLQFPTGETAMKIESLGDNLVWQLTTRDFSQLSREELAERGRSTQLLPRDLKVGREIVHGPTGESWIVTDVLGEGRFKAVPQKYANLIETNRLAYFRGAGLNLFIEIFDISGKIDKNNPIYRFYEKDVQKFLKRFRPDTKRVKDPQGVEWFEVPITPEEKGLPVEAFGALAGVEVEKDEEGKYRVRFRPEKAVLGMVGMGIARRVKGIPVSKFVPEKPPKLPTVKPKAPKLTVAQLLKQKTVQGFTSYLDSAESQKEFVKRVQQLSANIDKAVISDKAQLKQLRASAVKKIEGLTGVKGLGRNYKQDYALLQMAKEDPDVEQAVGALEEFIVKIDDKVGAKTVKKAFEVARDEGLSTEGKYFIPYGKYSTKGTFNREWVRENIPLLYMGNKRGMIGYILDVLGIKQKDLGSITKDDVSHLSDVKRVHDLFGGSGLLSSLSKKLFPEADIVYNELSPGTLKAIERTQRNPKPVRKFVSEVAVWLRKHPDADWLSHFSTVYKDNDDFLTAAKLIEASAGRTEVTAEKIGYVWKAIPNFAKTFKGVKTTSQDALKELDRLAETGTKGDFVWIDPPYLWSSGYGVGTAMEKAAGFRDLLSKLDRLNKKGVKFVFFNNDPEVQSAKAGTESVHLDNIMGHINKLSEDMMVIRGIKPIGAAKRREIVITNLEYGKDIGRLLNLDETKKAIEALKDDPATAPREVLKMFRELRGTTELVPQAKRITAYQVRTIRTLRKRLRVKNRELLPIMDEILDDHSFAKMTREDGVRLIDWLQPRNWATIEDHVARTRKELFEKKTEKLIGERFVAKDTELEDKYGVLEGLNKTASEIENIASIVKDLPPLEPDNAKTLRSLFQWTSSYVSEDLGAKLVGIKQGFHTPMRAIINIGKVHQNRMEKSLTKMFADLSKEERRQVIFIQAGAPSAIKKPMSDKVKKYAKYIQDIAEKNIALVNRLRAAKGQKPLKSRKPYIPFIIDENISEAANLFDKHKFWEQRTKTFKEFQAGLFTHDPERIIKLWSQSSGNWLKKNLFTALLLDRYQNLYNVSGAAAAYGRTIVQLDIYNMMPDGERLFRSLGTAINQFVGSIFPKKIPIDPDLAEALRNTTFGKELADNIDKGYLTIPRVQLPNAGDVFHKVFYPAKLAWNFGFGLLNRQQVYAGIPFEGVTGKVVGRIKLYSMIFPWNWKHAKRYIKILEEGGYQFGRHIAGQELKPIRGKILGSVDRAINFIGDITELMNRLENELGAEKFINIAENRMGEKLSREDKDKVIGTYSAFINFLSGKGYAPPAQRTMAGRLLYTFNQYPINQINVFTEMYRVAMKDNGVREFWKMMAREGGASQEAVDFFDKLPDGSKGRVFLIFLALALPVATLYALSRSWNVASRALPGLPRIAFSDLASAVSDFMESPEKNKDALVNSVKKLFSITAKKRLEDVFNVVDSGIIQRGISKRPIFVDRSIDNIARLAIFGRGVLEEYEKQYPSLLGKLFGGKRESGEVGRLQREQKRARERETEIAVGLLRELSKADTPEQRREILRRYLKEGKLGKRVLDKVIKYSREKARGTSGLERSIINLDDRFQAKFVLSQLKKAKTKEERRALLLKYAAQGILTKNVLKEIVSLKKEERGIGIESFPASP